MPVPPRPRRPRPHRLAALAAALALHAAALAAPGDGVSVTPGIAFAWTDPGSAGLLVFQLEPRPAGSDPITDIRSTSRHLAVTGFEIAPDDRQLTLTVRADAAGVIAVPALTVRTGYAPARRVRVGAAEVVALPEVGGALSLRRWSADTELGLYAAFALENSGPTPLVVRTLRYAPEPIGRGLLLVDHGPIDAFGTWRDAVLGRMTPAFAAFLEGHGRSRYAPDAALRPTSLAFPLAGELVGARWRAPTAIDVRLEPGEALYAAVTPAAFAAYVADLGIVAYPVVGYDANDGLGCCRLQGVPAPILNVARSGGSTSP